MRVPRHIFDQLMDDAVTALPKQFVQWLDEVAIVVEDEPSPEILRDMGMDDDDDLLGSFTGHAITRRSVEESAHLPPQIMIFRKPLMDMCRNREHLAREIRKTLLHELGHYAGFDEDDLEEMGYG